MSTIEIPLTGKHGGVALVDAADLHLVEEWSWRNRPHGYTSYAYAWSRYPGIRRARHLAMHRVILGAPDGIGVDHRNGNGLDNRRSNLRLATQAQNIANRHRTWGRSRYKGASYDKRAGRWLAQTTHGGRTVYLGRHATEVEAALAYDAYARETFGEFAHLNFPEVGV